MVPDTNLTQIPDEKTGKMKFPVKLRKRRAEVRIYGRTAAYPSYRVAFYAAGKRVVESFKKYSDALHAARTVLDELCRGAESRALTPREVTDMLGIRDLLAELHAATGRKMSASQVVSEYVEAAKLLGDGESVVNVVKQYLRVMAKLKPMRLDEAVKSFVALQRAKSVSNNGGRPALCERYVDIVEDYLIELCNTFQNCQVGHLSVEGLDLHMSKFGRLAAKSRNDRRATIKQFLRWCTLRDYIEPTQASKLVNCDALKKEPVVRARVDFYRVNELRALLDAAPAELVPIIALQAFGGVRLEEALRMSWANVFSVEGHIEIGAEIAKLRSRRLVKMCPTLAAWLEPYRGRTGRVWTDTRGVYLYRFNKVRTSLGIPYRRNGLRHGWVSHYFALTNDENLTASQAGHDPTMLHANYRGLVSESEARLWFDVVPQRPQNVVSITAGH
ncbi:MAG: hypothetical protein GX456_15860 [Verrucomicrobia bacterium]|nr:hypothetical protein [Verrucomicrobiota bacterium]